MPKTWIRGVFAPPLLEPFSIWLVWDHATLSPTVSSILPSLFKLCPCLWYRPQSCLRTSLTLSLWTTGASEQWSLNAFVASGPFYTTCSQYSGESVLSWCISHWYSTETVWGLTIKLDVFLDKTNQEWPQPIYYLLFLGRVKWKTKDQKT